MVDEKYVMPMTPKPISMISAAARYRMRRRRTVFFAFFDGPLPLGPPPRPGPGGSAGSSGLIGMISSGMVRGMATDARPTVARPATGAAPAGAMGTEAR